jgi:hypothetical protein
MSRALRVFVEGREVYTYDEATRERTVLDAYYREGSASRP